MRFIQMIVVVLVGIVLLASAATIIASENDEKVELDVFMVGGQSNTYPKISVDATTASPVPDVGTGFYFGTDSDPSYAKTVDLTACSMHDLNKNGVSAIGGMYSPFAKEYYEKTGRICYLIDTGLSGQPLATFLPSGSNYEWVQSVVEYGMAAIPDTYNVNVRGYIWIHGEGDKNTPTQTYEVGMIQLHDIYADGGLSAKFPTCYMSKVRSAQGTNSEIAQEWLADNIPGFVMASEVAETFTTTNGTLYTDELHYTQKGFNELGVDLADNISEEIVIKEKQDYTDLMLVFIPLAIVTLIMVIVRFALNRD